MGIRNWLRQALKEDRADRYAIPDLVAHFWDGGAPKAHPVKNISETGAYLCVNERLYEGTLIDVALRRASESASESALSVQCKVVRHGPDGIGVTFLLHTQLERRALKQFMKRTIESATGTR